LDFLKNNKSIQLRCILLFLLLLIIKSILIIILREDLFQAHWRTGTATLNWFTYFNYYYLLGSSATIFLLLTSPNEVSKRRLNYLFILTTIAIFILTIFYQKILKDSYIYLFLTETLSLRNLYDYLFLDFIDHPPYYAIYLFAITLAIPLAHRYKKPIIARLTIIAAATIYFILNIEVNIAVTDSVIFLNLFATIIIYQFWKNKKTPQPTPKQPKIYFTKSILKKTITIITITFIPAWLLFQAETSTVKTLTPTIILIICLALLFATILFCLLLPKMNQPKIYAIIFTIFAFIIVASRNYGAASNLNKFILYCLAIPHYFTFELLTTLTIISLTLLLNKIIPNKKILPYITDIIILTTLFIAIVDLLSVKYMGCRLSWQSLTMCDDPLMLIKMIKPYLLKLSILFITIITIYTTLLLILKNKIDTITNHLAKQKYLATFIIISMLISFQLIQADKATGFAIFRIIESTPFVKSLKDKRYTPEEFLTRFKELGYKIPKKTDPKNTTTKPNDYNLILIIMESSYNKYLSLFGATDETQPLLKKYKKQMEIFTNFYSTFPNSNHARFSIYSGLYSTEQYVSYLNPQIPEKTLPEILAQYNYENTIFYSSAKEYTRFYDYIGHRSIHHFYDCNNMPEKNKYEKVSWGVEEKCTLNAITKKLKKYQTNKQKFFLTYIPAAPHRPFDCKGEEFKKFPIGTPSITGDYSGVYKNQLLYMDWIYSQILETLKQTKLQKNTIIIITDDHGEMLGENKNPTGHGWLSTPKMCNVPLIIIHPKNKKFKINTTLSAQIDILPTTLDMLNIPIPTDEFYQGISLYSKQAKQKRNIYLDSYEQRGMICQNKYYVEKQKDKNKQGTFTDTYTITFQGAKTNFTLEKTKKDISTQLDNYKKLQKSLIIHYKYYKKNIYQKK